MFNIFKKHNLNLKLKLRLLRFYVFSIFLYGVVLDLNGDNSKETGDIRVIDV